MSFLVRAWYNKAPWLWLLWPISLLFRALAAWRKRSQQAQLKPCDVPVIVVGNIAVGGTGKTPLLIALCKHLQTQGMQPGVISRGYGAKGNSYPLQVDDETSVEQAGDEPVLIAEKTGCPVVVDPNRAQALQTLLAKHQVDVVLSDDGLQHYRLPRRIEIAVVDGTRLFGNELCLPAGPLREPVSRLQSVDLLVVNGGEEGSHPALEKAHRMHIKSVALVNLASGEKRPFSGAPFNIGNTIQAVAAIGNPLRFFESLESLPYPLQRFVFPDHYRFQASDFDETKLDLNQPVVMTEKDATKCRDFATPNMWLVETVVELPPAFLSSLDAALSK
ncbi:MAG: tetraacyldisaccharide 4'-kinase [Pseudomonadales bacterium]|nr:tetraacyldisaccharide 4'-kinase [Pseudomonadales bacterium]